MFVSFISSQVIKENVRTKSKDVEIGKCRAAGIRIEMIIIIIIEKKHLHTFLKIYFPVATVIPLFLSFSFSLGHCLLSLLDLVTLPFH